MINYLRHMAIFAQVIDEGSFRGAAKQLGLAPSRVSETVSDLEEYLDATLLYRNTRKLQLTHEGRIFYEHIKNMVKHAESGLNELNAYSETPTGELKISLPAFMASSELATVIAKFAHQYPKISLSLIYTDHILDFFKEGLDMSIRVGWLQDSSLMSRKLGQSRRLLVASKDYIQTKSLQPKHPSELKGWDWIRFQMRSNSLEFYQKNSIETVSIHENSRICVNSAEAMKHFTCQGLGLSVLPQHLVENYLKRGELIHLLPEWEVEPLGYYALWPDKSRRENLVTLLVRFIAEHNL
ncbi:MAG: LysR family transcriptional regulator [Pseudomonadota bacterium]